MYKEYNIKKTVSSTGCMVILILWVKALDCEYPLHDNALQIAQFSKEMINIKTKGPNQRDNLLIRHSNN